MFRRFAVFAAALSLSACIASPVAVVGPNGLVLKGTIDQLGSFTVSNGTLTCTGTRTMVDDQIGRDSTPVTCSDGRKGAVVANGRLRLNDGTEADFVLGDAAKNF